MMMVHSMARALEEAGENDPEVFLSNLNRAIFKNIERTGTEKHMSLAFLDFSGHEVVLTGQHEDIIILRENGDLEILDTTEFGFPVGLEPDIERFVASKTFHFGDGDVIVLYTDGITEAVNKCGVMFGLDRLCKSALAHREGNAGQIKSGIIEDLLEYIGDAKIYDDITLIVIRHR